MKLDRVCCTPIFTTVFFAVLLIVSSTHLSGVGSPGVTCIKDCPDCPELVIIPAGSFIMGSPDMEEGHEPGEIQHRVAISKPFALGKNPVTKREFRQFVSETGYNAKGKCFSLDMEGNVSESERYKMMGAHMQTVTVMNHRRSFLGK